MLGTAVAGLLAAILAIAGLSEAEQSAPLVAAALNNPPWLLLSGLVAAPSVLLTWYWRTIQRERDLAHREQELAHREQELEQRGREIARQDEQWKSAQAQASEEKKRLVKESDSKERLQANQLFADAAEKLAQESVLGRVAALRMLERSAYERSHLVVPVIDTVASFIRLHAGRRPDEPPRSPGPEDIRLALLIIGRIRKAWVEEDAYADQLNEEGYLLAVDLNATTLRGAKFAGNYYLTDFGVSDLSCSSMSNGWFSYATFDGATLHEASAQGASMAHATFVGADLTGADFRKCELREADFASANVSGTNFIGSTLRAAKLAAVRNIYNALWENAVYDETTTFPDGFDPHQHGMKYESL